MSNASMICFMLPLNASKSDAEGVIERITDLFKLDADAGIPATQATSTASVPVQNPIPLGEGRPSVEAMAASEGMVSLDSDNVPWDERIHASTKAKNEDGTWRAKRGVDKSLFTRIKNQLKAQMATQAPAAALATNPAPVIQAAPALPAPPAAASGLPPLPGANVNPAFTEFVQFITANSPPFTPEYVKAGLAGYGIADGDIQNLAHRPDLIPAIRAAFGQAIGK